MTATTTTALPKNQTGVYAGNSLEEIKPIRAQINGIPVSSLQQRSKTSANHLAGQNRLVRNALQSYYPYVTTHAERNGFPPSIVRRQKSRPSTTITPRESRENLSKDLYPTTPTSARLKSEIDQLNNQLKIYGDLNRILRLQNERETSAISQSTLSYSTSCRISSASTNHAGSRLHQRFPSALNNTTIDTTDKSMLTSSSPVNDPESGMDEINHRFTHAFQIPQQCNVGNASIFPLNPSPPPAPAPSTSSGARSIKSGRLSNGNKSVSCPFYVMYFANLAMQHRSNSSSRVPSASSTITAHRTSARRQLQSPISVNTYSTLEDDNVSNRSSTSYYNNKRFSAKMAAFENENSHLLKDVLRTTSWNHLQV